MTISRSYAIGWGIGDKLLSSQMNSLDQSLAYALDKRAGQSDTLESVVTFATTGRLIVPPATGANADTTYVVTGANRSVRVTTAVTANRIYTLGSSGAALGDTILIFCDAAFAYEITVKNWDGSIIYALGYKTTSEASWAEFIFNGTDWQTFRGPGASLRTVSWTANDTLVVPRGVTKMIVELVGGGGGGGGGRGNSTSGDASAPGGGGARRTHMVVTVVPGETLTFAVGGGGAGGTGGSSGGAAGTSGSPGSDSTLTGSTSGLLATAYGAQGGVFATNSAGFYQGGLPVRWGNLSAGTRQYPGNSTSPLTTGGGQYPDYPIPGQGGFAGTVAMVDAKAGGSTQYALGGSIGVVDSTYAGSGGASEWEGGTGGASGGIVSAPTSGGNGGNGALGSGGGGGAGGWTGVAGGNGGNGGDGAGRVSWMK